MAVFFVNGKSVEATKNQKLLRFLRDELRLTSVKDGCSEGACGACTVIIDGETVRACTPMTDRLEGKHILTVEGLTEEEKKLYTYAYGEAGAVPVSYTHLDVYKRQVRQCLPHARAHSRPAWRRRRLPDGFSVQTRRI